MHRYPLYKARKQLVVIDWNYHKDLPPCTSSTHDGEIMVTRKYNQRTKAWDSKIVKKKGLYICLPHDCQSTRQKDAGQKICLTKGSTRGR